MIDKVLETKITIDFSKSEDQLKQIKSHDIASEFTILQKLVDSNPITEKRFYDAIDMQKNRYSEIFPCIISFKFISIKTNKKNLSYSFLI